MVQNRQQLVIPTYSHVSNYSVVESKPALGGNVVDYSQNSRKT